MKVDRLPVAEGLVGFLLVMLLVTFLLARHYVGDPDSKASAAVSPTASAGTPQPGKLEITMSDNKFDQTSLTVPAGADVSIPLTNKGAAVHNLHVSAASGSFGDTFCKAGGAEPCSNPTKLAANATGTLDFNLPAGTYNYRCDYHPTEMKGSLTVQ